MILSIFPNNQVELIYRRWFIRFFAHHFFGTLFCLMKKKWFLLVMIYIFPESGHQGLSNGMFVFSWKSFIRELHFSAFFSGFLWLDQLTCFVSDRVICSFYATHLPYPESTDFSLFFDTKNIWVSILLQYIIHNNDMWVELITLAWPKRNSVYSPVKAAWLIGKCPLPEYWKPGFNSHYGQ